MAHVGSVQTLDASAGDGAEGDSIAVVVYGSGGAVFVGDPEVPPSGAGSGCEGGEGGEGGERVMNSEDETAKDEMYSSGGFWDT